MNQVVSADEATSFPVFSGLEYCTVRVGTHSEPLEQGDRAQALVSIYEDGLAMCSVLYAFCNYLTAFSAGRVHCNVRLICLVAT